MTLLQTIDKYEKLAQSKNAEERHAALLFALQIPSILSRMEYPQTPDNTGSDNQNPKNLYRENGRPWDENLYRKWMTAHVGHFQHYFYFTNTKPEEIVDNIYELRNSMTHAGILPCQYKKFIFAETDGCGLCLPNVVFLSIHDFCDSMFIAARNCLAELRLGNSQNYLEVPRVIYKNEKEQLISLYNNFWKGRTDEELYHKYYYFFNNASETEVLALQNDNRIAEDECKAICKLYYDLRALNAQVDQTIRTIYPA